MREYERIEGTKIGKEKDARNLLLGLATGILTVIAYQTLKAAEIATDKKRIWDTSELILDQVRSQNEKLARRTSFNKASRWFELFKESLLTF